MAMKTIEYINRTYRTLVPLVIPVLISKKRELNLYYANVKHKLKYKEGLFYPAGKICKFQRCKIGLLIFI
ncbi:hypothetical protein U473_00440 [Tepidibacillus decaturensis]|uniref:Uncharacterized protein n=1 Tax=Tepidibacillus decaturensis TaxID=1413211 RepID=A0A135L145_9BACI|nr:hypothetical protein U473_00440 [Tepidibacillus decaturensis]